MDGLLLKMFFLDALELAKTIGLLINMLKKNNLINVSHNYLYFYFSFKFFLTTFQPLPLVVYSY